MPDGVQNVFLKIKDIITGNQTKAMALYKAGTMGASVQTMLFAARQKAAAGIGFLGTIIKQGASFVVLTAKTIASTAAVVAHAVAQNAATIATNIAAAAQWALNAAMSANPIGLIIIGVVALIAAIILLVKNWDKVSAAFKKAFEAIGNFFVKIWEGVKSFFGKVVEFVKKNALNILNVILGILFFPAGVIMAVVRLIIKHWDKIKEGLLKVWEGIKAVFGKMKDFIGGVFNKVKEGAVKAWGGIKNGASKALEGIKGGVSKAGEFLKGNWKTIAVGMVSPMAGGFKVLYDHNEKFRGFVDNTWGKIKDITGAVWDKMPDGVQNVFLKIKDIITGAINGIKSIFEGFKNFFTGLWDALKQGPAATVDYIKNVFINLFENIKEKFFGFIDVIKSGFDAVKGVFGAVGDFFTGKNKKKTDVAPQVNNIVPAGINQPVTATAGIPAYAAPGVNNRDTRTISSAAAPAVRPVTPAEQYRYSESVSREQVDINVRAQQGAQASVTRPPRSPNVSVTASGGNR
jgi:phage-related protein